MARTATEVANEKLREWEAEERSAEMEADGHARRRYREIIARMASAVEFKQLVEAAMRPPPLTNREIITAGLLRDPVGRRRLLDYRTGLSRREAERAVCDVHPALAAAAKEASDTTESDGNTLAQIRRELNVPAERVDRHVGFIVDLRRFVRRHADVTSARKRIEAARAAFESAKREAQVAELDFDAARHYGDECARAQISIITLESECPILFEGEHDYALSPPLRRAARHPAASVVSPG